MSVKRIFDENDRKGRRCLNCGGIIPQEERLKDNSLYTCKACGQKHFVDKLAGRVTLTKKEYLQYRRRTNPKDAAGKIAALEEALTEAKEEALEWQKAAEGLAAHVEQLKMELDKRSDKA